MARPMISSAPYATWRHTNLHPVFSRPSANSFRKTLSPLHAANLRKVYSIHTHGARYPSLPIYARWPCLLHRRTNALILEPTITATGIEPFLDTVMEFLLVQAPLLQITFPCLQPLRR